MSQVSITFEIKFKGSEDLEAYLRPGQTVRTFSVLIAAL